MIRNHLNESIDIGSSVYSVKAPDVPLTVTSIYRAPGYGVMWARVTGGKNGEQVHGSIDTLRLKKAA